MSASKAGRARGKRREARRERRRRDQMAARLGMPASGARPWPGLTKMSDVLVEFAEPLLEDLDKTSPLEEYMGVLRFASVVWNILAMVEAEERRAGGVDALADGARMRELEALLDQAVGGMDAEGEELVAMLWARRRALFPDERRIFMNIDAEIQGDRVHVTAASTMIG
jgi:hypothetical protein